jgi:hypothetical protein
MFNGAVVSLAVFEVAAKSGSIDSNWGCMLAAVKVRVHTNHDQGLHAIAEHHCTVLYCVALTINGKHRRRSVREEVRNTRAEPRPHLLAEATETWHNHGEAVIISEECFLCFTFRQKFVKK